jgi:2-keto-3-deoxy-L-rhamnonate aldolase RhmA
VFPILQEERVKKNRVRELWKQGKPAVQGWCATGNPYIAEMMGHAGFDAVVLDWQHGVGVSQESVVACHHGAGPGVSAQFVKMGAKLCQIGNEMRMLTTATAEALRAFRGALS